MIPTTISTASRTGGSDRVIGAIRNAAARTGVDFSYLLGQARIESSLNPNARARTSSATGLYQFIDQTWLGTVKQHGAEHGLGWAADAIRRGHNGRFYVADPQMRRAILDLRKQPEAAAAMAGEFASDNRQYLESRLGRPAQPVDLYLAHFLGAGGAARFLRAHDANPEAAAASIVPAAARANRWVFFNRDGSARSFSEVRQRFASKLDGGATPSNPIRPDLPPVRTASLNVERVRPSPEYARIAYMMLAQLGE
ncbi:MAG TPA: transglycosylase SLT domain-containing protein [Allosphingosinicella sp.]|nr:transglycosylase SLT domain-containing protein [Allosphingosinicella sp.]